MVRKITAAAIAALFVPVVHAADAVSWEKLWTFTHGAGTSVAGQTSEIVAFDSLNNELWVAGLKGIDILSASTGSFVQHIDTTAWGELNSVAVRNGVAAFAIAAPVKTAAGTVLTFDTTSRSMLNSYSVGALPDMVTFTPDGRIMTANEGEPLALTASTTQEARGSISIIDTTRDAVTTLGFSAYDGTNGLGRIVTPGSKPSLDWEPEYIAVAKDGKSAMVTLQEANAVAMIDLTTNSITSVKSLGLKDFSLPQNAIDTSDRDGLGNTALTGNYRAVPVKGMYMPDAIASFQAKGKTWLITANEGDAREYTGFAEEVRVATHCPAGLDPAVFADVATLIGNAGLGRLNVTNTPNGDRTGKNAAGQCTELYSFGGRSFSIWNTDIQRVADSGEDLERLTTNLPNVLFNASNTNNTLESRSTSKGPEPEGVTVARFGPKTFAFIGLERVGGVVVYDVSEPAKPRQVSYLNTREGADKGDRGPEGLTYIPADDSPTGEPLLVVGHESSGTTAVYRIRPTY